MSAQSEKHLDPRTDLRAAALDWIRTALREEKPDADAGALAAAAEMLHAQAVEFDVPVDELIRWIHEDRAYDPASWRAHCSWYVEFRRHMCEGE
jgi:hypothetical protein